MTEPNIEPTANTESQPILNSDTTSEAKKVPLSIPSELLSEPDIKRTVAGIAAWANGLRPKKKLGAFAKPVTRAIVTSTIRSPEVWQTALNELYLDGSLFELTEAAAALQAAVLAKVDCDAEAISKVSVLLGAMAINLPLPPGTKPRPTPSNRDKTIAMIIACHHHTGKVEGCLSRAVTESLTSGLDIRGGNWIWLATAELKWTCTAKGNARRHLAGIARGITDVIAGSKDIDPVQVIPLLLALTSADTKGDRDATIAIMALRRRLVDSPTGQNLRSKLQWLLHREVTDLPLASPPATVVTGRVLDPEATSQRTIEELRRDLTSVRAELADRDRALQKARTDAGEIAVRLQSLDGERKDALADLSACDAELIQLRAAVEDGAKALADESARFQKTKADLTTMRTSMVEDSRRHERAIRALMANRLFEKIARISEWLQAVESGKADFKGLREVWEDLIQTLQNEAGS